MDAYSSSNTLARKQYMSRTEKNAKQIKTEPYCTTSHPIFKMWKVLFQQNVLGTDHLALGVPELLQGQPSIFEMNSDACYVAPDDATELHRWSERRLEIFWQCEVRVHGDGVPVLVTSKHRAIGGA